MGLQSDSERKRMQSDKEQEKLEINKREKFGGKIRKLNSVDKNR